MEKLKSSGDLSLQYQLLDRTSLHIKTYSDSSFPTNDDCTSQLGYIILPCDSNNKSHILAYSSRNSRRVVRSSMAEDVYAFSTAFDNAYVIKHGIETIYRQTIPFCMFTESKQMFDVRTRATHATEKRLIIDLAAAREAYNDYRVSNVGLAPENNNPTGALTKPEPCKSLESLLSSGIDLTPVEQCIVVISVKAG